MSSVALLGVPSFRPPRLSPGLTPLGTVLFSATLAVAVLSKCVRVLHRDAPYTAIVLPVA